MRLGGRTGPGSMPRWSDEDTAMLRYMYPDCSNAEIAEELERTVSAVKDKASELGLKKSHERLRLMGRELVSRRKR